MAGLEPAGEPQVFLRSVDHGHSGQKLFRLFHFDGNDFTAVEANREDPFRTERHFLIQWAQVDEIRRLDKRIPSAIWAFLFCVLHTLHLLLMVYAFYAIKFQVLQCMKLCEAKEWFPLKYISSENIRALQVI